MSIELSLWIWRQILVWHCENLSTNLQPILGQPNYTEFNIGCKYFFCLFQNHRVLVTLIEILLEFVCINCVFSLWMGQVKQYIPHLINLELLKLNKSVKDTYKDIAARQPLSYRVNFPFENEFPALIRIQVNGIIKKSFQWIFNFKIYISFRQTSM